MASRRKYGLPGRRLRLLRLKYDRALRQQLGHWPALSQAQLARRMRLVRQAITNLEQRPFVGEEEALRVLDAMMAELVEQATGVEVDYDATNWGLPPEPLDRLDKPYHNRPRGPGGRWLPRGVQGSYTPPRPGGPVAPSTGGPQLAHEPAQARRGQAGALAAPYGSSADRR